VSKVDALRALREARYASSPSTAVPSKAVPSKAPQAPRVLAPVPPAEPGTTTCGHRSMNGRACTRDTGHVEKNHRYG
jgi:hypothetical protein